MSCEALLGLDELFDYKNQLINDLFGSETILQLLSDDGVTPAVPSVAMYSQVFPYEYVPETVEHGQTFICCEVDIREVNNKTILSPALYVWVFTHKSKMRLPEGGVRIDKLSSEIVKTINGSRMYGLGELELSSVRRFSPISNYYGRALTFYAKDFNRVSQLPKQVPSNRKHGS